MSSTLAGNIKIKFAEAFLVHVLKLVAGVGKLKKEKVYRSTIEFRTLDSFTEEEDVDVALAKVLKTSSTNRKIA